MFMLCFRQPSEVQPSKEAERSAVLTQAMVTNGKIPTYVKGASPLKMYFVQKGQSFSSM